MLRFIKGVDHIWWFDLKLSTLSDVAGRDMLLQQRCTGSIHSVGRIRARLTNLHAVEVLSLE